MKRPNLQFSRLKITFYMSKLKNQSLDSYTDWINSINWSFFGTFTTGYSQTLSSSRRLMERTHKAYKDYLGDCLFFWVAEPYELKDGYHTHGLLKVPDNMIKKNGLIETYHHKNLIDIYQRMAGGKVISNDHGKLTFDKWNRIELAKFDNRKNAGKYALKYIKKSQKNRGDYDILI